MIVVVSALCCLFLSGVAAQKMTVTGTVNDTHGIVTDDGTAFDAAGGEKGDEVVDLIGTRVKVTGDVEEGDGDKTITVITYEVLGE
jgi:hypothetical protein